jgi:pyridoxamine 5'-phosphate oxidase
MNDAVRLAEIRTDYRRDRLRRVDLKADPIEQFTRWLQEAIDEKALEPTAMSLATVSAEGHPLVRTVLLKGIDERGFVFFTNLGSRKASHLGTTPFASLLFPWLALERQVIVRGSVEPVSREEAEVYFASRPRESRLAAWASAQSSPIASREVLENELRAMEERFGDGDVPLPPFWGGFRVKPETVEFWQGGSHRLHDRFEYTRQPGGEWRIERLSP